MSNIFDGLVIPTIEDVLRKYCGPSVLGVERDCIVLGNLSCTGSDGRVFEHYDELRVDRDIARKPGGEQASFIPYQAAAHFEGQGRFLPSLALSCNILSCLYNNRDDKEINSVLMQYEDKGDGDGWHAQNTIAHWGNKKIIHYPCDSDFPKHGGTNNINKSKNRTELSFNNKGLKNVPLKKALKKDNPKAYIQDLTGLQHPETLDEIGQYFNKPAHIWIPNSNEVRAAWLGCYDDNLGIDAGDNLCDYGAARGVSSP